MIIAGVDSSSRGQAKSVTWASWTGNTCGWVCIHQM